MKGLGYKFDIGTAFAPVDFNTSDAATGARVHMRNYESIACVLFKGVGTAGADPVITVQEHDAASSGDSNDLAVIDEFFYKEDVTFVGTEPWVRATQAVAATAVVLTSAESGGLYVVEVSAEQLSAGYEWVSFNIAATVANAQLVAGFYIMTGLKKKRRPDLLAEPNA